MLRRGSAHWMTRPPLFIYGTLLHPPLFDLVARAGEGAAVAATLPDHAVVTAADGLPLLCAAAGQAAEGLLWRGLDPARLERLDRYEVPFGYRRRPVEVRTGAGPVAAEAYFPPADAGAGDALWALDVWIAAEGAATLHVATELSRHDPEMTGDEVVRQWPMMRARAHSRLRAAQDVRPATCRYAPHPNDVAVRAAAPLDGHFFKLAAMDLDHRRFDGSRATDLRREVLVGVDAALVLPYDPVRDVVLLVEQVRAAAAWRGDANPWTLEPPAGIVDAGETPEAAARREAAEEAGIEIVHLERMFAAYPSPGSNTDFFHCFVGLADLPEDMARHGGLASEAEDIALHRLAFADAMVLVASGEITALPLIAMLFWLGAHRDRLRG